MTIEVQVPKFAEGAVSIRLRRWLCAKGDRIEAGAHLAEAATDKFAIYIEAPAGGQVAELLAEAGDEVRVGQVIALITAA